MNQLCFSLLSVIYFIYTVVMVNSQPCINISKESIIKVIFLKNNNYEPKPQAVECSEHSVSGSFSAFRNCKKRPAVQALLQHCLKSWTRACKDKNQWKKNTPSLTSPLTSQSLLLQKGHKDESPKVSKSARQRRQINTNVPGGSSIMSFSLSMTHYHRFSQLTCHTHLAGTGTPQVDTGTQSHTEHIQRGPVH